MCPDLDTVLACGPPRIGKLSLSAQTFSTSNKYLFDASFPRVGFCQFATLQSSLVTLLFTKDAISIYKPGCTTSTSSLVLSPLFNAAPLSYAGCALKSDNSAVICSMFDSSSNAGIIIYDIRDLTAPVEASRFFFLTNLLACIFRPPKTLSLWYTAISSRCMISPVSHLRHCRIKLTLQI